MMIDRSSIEARDAIRADLSAAVNAFLEQGKQIDIISVPTVSRPYNVRTDFRLEGSPRDPKPKRKRDSKTRLAQRIERAAQRQAKLNDEIQTIRQMAATGASKVEVAEKLGRDRKWVGQKAVAHGIEFVGIISGKNLEAFEAAKAERARLAEIIKRDMMDLSGTEIAKDLGIAISHTYRILAEHDITLNSARRK